MTRARAFSNPAICSPMRAMNRPVENDAVLGLRGEDDLFLQVAERDHVEPAPQLVAVQHAGQVFRLLSGRAAEIRRAVKMDEHHLAAALHDPPGGEGGVDAAR